MAVTPKADERLQVEVSPPQTPTRLELGFYTFCRAVVLVVCKLLWRLEVRGTELVPEKGPYLVAATHRSNIDILVVGMITRRRLRYMGKDSLWRNPASAWLLSSLGGFPVHRGVADREALRRCQEVLAGGEPLVVYPEGTRRSGPEIGPIFDGSAYLASKAGVAMVPVGIAGSEQALGKGMHIPHLAKVYVVVGKPIPPIPGRAGRAELRVRTAELAMRMQEVQDEAERLRHRRGRLARLLGNKRS
jgi:1-acyl-sn-glycerol-3-phosphate acyltransferase